LARLAPESAVSLTIAVMSISMFELAMRHKMLVTASHESTRTERDVFYLVRRFDFSEVA
jgi:hypothetical protein